MRRPPQPATAQLSDPAEKRFLCPDVSGAPARAADRELSLFLRDEPFVILDCCDDAIIATTLDGVIVGWNRAARQMYGYEAAEIIGRPISVLCAPEEHRELKPIQAVREMVRFGRFETMCIRKDGAHLCVSVTVSPIPRDAKRTLGALIVARDISDQKKSEETIRYLATHDALTGLANYTSLLSAFDAELRRSDRTGRPFAVLLFDINGLKKLNDAHGHLVGSRALCRLANVLKRTCRSVDTAARYGGDEFAVLLVETDEAIASRVAQRIVERLAKDEEEPRVTTSSGIAVYPQDGYTVENLLAAADRALYKSKLRELFRAKALEGEMDPATKIAAERRRSTRLLLNVPLIVRGESSERQAFQERTSTISVSAHGALLVLATKVTLGQTLFIENPQKQSETEGRVVRFGSPYGGLAQVGIEFASPAPDFWPVESLPENWRSLRETFVPIRNAGGEGC